VRGKVTPQARAAARQAIIAQADMRAQALGPVIAEIRAAGVHSYKGIAAELDKPASRPPEVVAGLRLKSAT
jgi:hypothetical protein